MPEITTLLFDCDNTLVLSEELAFEGCADVLNDLCRDKNVALEKPFVGSTLIVEFVGQNFRGMIKSIQARYGFELTPEELDAYVAREEDALVARLRESLQPCPGVDAELEKLAREGRYRLAIVSSSAMRRVRASIEKVGQDRFFPADHVFSAANSLPVPTTKPDPAIYLHSMEVLGKTPTECVAIEDSKTGTLAATRAGIKTVGYVGPYEEDKRPEMEKVLRDAGAVIIMTEWSEFESCLAKIAAGSV